MVKSVLGAILTILSVPTLGMVVGNTVTVFTIWFAGGNYEIGQGMTASDYAKGLAYSFFGALSRLRDAVGRHVLVRRLENCAVDYSSVRWVGDIT